MNEIFSIKMNKKSKIPVYKQLGECLKFLIENDILKADTKLPPIRKMATALKVNTVTIVNAYKYLENKNVVYSVIGSGTYVAKLNKNITEVKSEIESYDFSLESEENHYFPTDDFNKFSTLVNETYKNSIFKTADNKGFPKFREKCLELFEKQQMFSELENIIVIKDLNVFPIECLAMNDKNPNDSQFRFFDMKEFEKKIKKNNPKFIYINSIFEEYENITYSQETINKFLKLSEKYNFIILEENYFFDTNTLKKFDKNNRVIYIQNFSFILNFKISICILPDNFNLKLPKISQEFSYVQKIFAEFMGSNEYLKYSSYLKDLYSENYDFARNFITKHLSKELSFISLKGQMFFLLKILNKDIKKECLESFLYEKGFFTKDNIFTNSNDKLLFFNISSISREILEKLLCSLKFFFDNRVFLKID